MLTERDIELAHPDAFDFAFGNLPSAKRAEFNRHLGGCSHCQRWRPESGVKGRARFQFMVMLGDGADIPGTVVVPGRGYGACPELAGRFEQ